MELIDKKILHNVKDSIYKIAATIRLDHNELSDKLINNWTNFETLLNDHNIEYDFPMRKFTFIKNYDLNKNTLESHLKQMYKRGRLLKGENEDYFIEGAGRTAETFINKKGAIKILDKCHSIEGLKYLRKYNNNIHLKRCLFYKSIIKMILKAIDNPKIEFAINNPRYRIDLYLEKSKLPIECDEVNHEYEPYENRLDREEDIKKKLGCHEFLRFNPHDQDFNFEKLIKCIIFHILGKTVNGQDPIDYYMGNPTKEELALFD